MIPNDVVQFNERHKWCGCLGIIRGIKLCKNDKGEEDVRFMVGVPCPQEGTAYIFVMESERAIERIGSAIMIPQDKEEE